MKTITTNSIQMELLTGLKPNQEFTLKDAYQTVSSTDKQILFVQGSMKVSTKAYSRRFLAVSSKWLTRTIIAFFLSMEMAVTCP